MTEINGRPQPYIGVGGVVGAEIERKLEEIASELGVDEHERSLLLSVNATHAAQFLGGVEPWQSSDINWNPQNAAQLQEALSGGDGDTQTRNMVTVRFHEDMTSNPGYPEAFAKQVLKRASWADVIRFSGLKSNEFESLRPNGKPSHIVKLFADLQSQVPEKQIAAEYPLPTLEALKADGALETTVEQLAHYAKVLEYIVFTTKEHSIRSARALLEAVYETPELASVGFAVEAQTSDKATNTRMTKLLKDFPDLSVHAEVSLHPDTNDKTQPLDLVRARQYVKSALDAIDAGTASPEN